MRGGGQWPFNTGALAQFFCTTSATAAALRSSRGRRRPRGMSTSTSGASTAADSPDRWQEFRDAVIPDRQANLRHYVQSCVSDLYVIALLQRWAAW